MVTCIEPQLIFCFEQYKSSITLSTMLNDAMQNEKSTKRENKKNQIVQMEPKSEKESKSEEPWKQFLLGKKIYENCGIKCAHT